MLKRYNKWFLNTPIKNKFIPMQIISIIIILTIGVISILSVITLNNMSQTIFSKNVEKTERLNEIIQTMYKCRVLGRDILFEENVDAQLQLYGEYNVEFNNLDEQMDSFLQYVSQEKKESFEKIIEQKDIYKLNMILSADIHLQGGEFEKALEVLQSVTPVANEFFGSLDDFLQAEKEAMDTAMHQNDTIVIIVFVTVIVSNIVAAILILVLYSAFAKVMSKSLISLEESVLTIANTNNLKKPIPPHLFTKDELGLIAKVVDKLRRLLLDYSFKDSLTGGLNSAAYYDELAVIFDSKRLMEETYERSFWVCVFDMNNLKIINDTLGHVEGDEAIKAAHNILVKSFETIGKTFRVGGDEFVVIATNCGEEDIVKSIELMNVKIDEANRNKDIKFGLAHGYEKFSGTNIEQFEEYFKIADKKMYKNKDDIKNVRKRIAKTNTIEVNISGSETELKNDITTK